MAQNKKMAENEAGESINQSINHSLNQSVEQSINRPDDGSVEQSFTRSKMNFFTFIRISTQKFLVPRRTAKRKIILTVLENWGETQHGLPEYILSGNGRIRFISNLREMALSSCQRLYESQNPSRESHLHQELRVIERVNHSREYRWKNSSAVLINQSINQSEHDKTIYRQSINQSINRDNTRLIVVVFVIVIPFSPVFVIVRNSSAICSAGSFLVTTRGTKARWLSSRTRVSAWTNCSPCGIFSPDHESDLCNQPTMRFTTTKFVLMKTHDTHLHPVGD